MNSAWFDRAAWKKRCHNGYLKARSIIRLFGLVFYTSLIMGFGVFVFLLPQQQKRRANMLLCQFWCRMLCLVYQLRVRNEGHPIPYQPGYLVVANHTTFIDIIVIGTVMPGIFLSMSQVRFWPVVGLGAMMIGTIFVDRSSKESRQRVRDEILQRLHFNQNIILFPEGKTSDGHTLLPFRYGAFDLAIKANKPVLPVAINYGDPELMSWSGNFVRTLYKIGQRDHMDVRVHIGELMGSSTYRDSVDMAEDAWQVINTMLIHFGMRASARLAAVDWQDYRLKPSANETERSNFMARLLSLLLQVDSSNAAGERQICQILTNVLDANYVPSKLHLSPAGHTNLVATKGKPSVNTLDHQHCYVVLLSHGDVVATEVAGWHKPPFSGAQQDGYIWGRGSIDMKGLLVVYLTAFLTAPKSVPLHFICVADEERGGREGGHFIAQSQLDQLRAKVLISHGGFGFTDLLGSEQPIFLIDTAEKGSLWLRLHVKLDTSAHSATPPEEYPLQILMNALQRITTMESELVVLPVTEQLLASIRQKSSLFSRIVSQALQVPIFANQLRGPLANQPFLRAMFRNSIAVTQVVAGEAENVLAQDASATLDCRLLPGVETQAFVRKLQKNIDDKRVEIDITHSAPPNETSFTDENFRKLRLAIEEECPQATVCPCLLPVHTSLGFFRQHELPCFGIFPALFKQDDLNRIHGADERISVEQLQLAYRIVSNFINRYAG